jgi:hypothetical protein
LKICTNIPKIDTKDIITRIPKINFGINEHSQKEIIHILETAMQQNYFQFEEKYYKQTDGLAVGAPTSAILAKAYTQNMEHKQIHQILIKHEIIGYFKYVDGILLFMTKWKQLYTKYLPNSTNNPL